MALSAVVENLDDVPENFHELYKEQSGVFVLGVEGIDNHPSVKTLKNAHERQKKTNTDLKAEVENLNLQIEAFGDLTPEGLDELREAAQSDGKPTDEQINEMLEKRFSATRNKLEKANEQLSAELEAKVEALGSMTNELSEIKIFSELDQAFLAAGGRKNAIEDFRNRARGVWKMNEENQPTAYEGGEPIQGVHGPLGIPEWVEQQRDIAEYFFDGNTGGNAGGGDAGATPGVTVIDLSQPNAIGSNLEQVAAGNVRLTGI